MINENYIVKPSLPGRWNITVLPFVVDNRVNFWVFIDVVIGGSKCWWY